jgi:molecular chaperone DnaK
LGHREVWSVSNLRDALKSEDGDRIKKSMEALNAASQKLAEAMYSAGGAGAAPGGAQPGPEASTDRGTTAGAGGKKDEDVIDAEYEVKDNK